MAARQHVKRAVFGAAELAKPALLPCRLGSRPLSALQRSDGAAPLAFRGAVVAVSPAQSRAFCDVQHAGGQKQPRAPKQSKRALAALEAARASLAAGLSDMILRIPVESLELESARKVLIGRQTEVSESEFQDEGEDATEEGAEDEAAGDAYAQLEEEARRATAARTAHHRARTAHHCARTAHRRTHRCDGPAMVRASAFGG